MTLLALNLYLSRHDFRDMWKWMKRRSRPKPNKEGYQPCDRFYKENPPKPKLGSMPKYENPPEPPLKEGGICFLGSEVWIVQKNEIRPATKGDLEPMREAANNITSEEKSEYDMDDDEDFGDIDDEDLDADYGYSKPKPLKTVSERWIIIKACSDPMMWYARQIARHYKVEKECLDYYWVKENGTGPINIVHKQDASLYLQKKLI